MNNFQRKGAVSNSHVGKDFETKAIKYFAGKGLELERAVSVEIGINGTTKPHKFDIGNDNVIVECKSHTWTEGNNVPSAKMTAWNQAMYFFHAAPGGYRKILFVLYDYNKKKSETLGQYYIRTYPHLIPLDVEVWEFNELTGTGSRLK